MGAKTDNGKKLRAVEDADNINKTVIYNICLVHRNIVFKVFPKKKPVYFSEDMKYKNK